MTVSLTDSLVQKSRGTVDQAIKYLKTPSSKLEFTKAYLRELWRLCELTGIDFAFAASQFAHETARGTSDAWIDEGNPAGIGIMDGGQRESMIYDTGEKAARAQMVHLYAYVLGKIPQNSELFNYISLDPRYDNVFSGNMGGTIKRIEQFGNGKWATDPNYAEGIVAHANAGLTTGGTAPTGGNMTPTIIDKYLHVAQDGYAGVNRRYIGANEHKIIVLHIQEGTSWGSWTWFHNTTASSTVFANRDGSIWRLVPEADAPWTNGDVSSPTAAGWRVINAYGSDPNYYTLSIETEGYASSNNAMGWQAWPKPQAQLDAVVWQVKDWMQRYNIPIENVLRHADINQVSRPGCPGDAYYNYVINAVKNSGPVTPVEPVYAKPVPVVDTHGVKWDGKADLQVGTATFRAQKQKVKTQYRANIRQHASRNAAETRAPLEPEKGFSVLGWVNGEEVNGERRWWITEAYSRVHVSATHEKPNIPQIPLPTDPDETTPDPAEKPDNAEFGPKIVNGKPYYSVKEIEGEETRRIKLVADAEARRSAKLGSTVVKTYKKDDIVEAAFFTLGDAVDGEEVWWVLAAEGKKNPIHNGLRIPASKTNVRPN